MTMLTNESMATGPWLDPKLHSPLGVAGGKEELASTTWLIQLNDGRYNIGLILESNMVMTATGHLLDLLHSVKRFALINRT